MTLPRRPKRTFTPQQKFDIIQDIRQLPTIKEGLEKYQISSSMYGKWKRQLEIGVNASLRNTKPIKPANIRHLEVENKKLKEMVLNLSHEIVELKKTLILN
jgi:transposase-like protein